MKKQNNKRNRKQIVVTVFFIVVLLSVFLFSPREQEDAALLERLNTASSVQLKEKKEISGFATKTRVEKKKKENEKEKKKNETKNESTETKKNVTEKEKAKEKETGEQEETEEYFTTSIVDGEIVTQRMYMFTITHLNKKLTVNELQVFVNENQVDFKGKVNLSKDENSIVIKVIYQNEKKEHIEVEKSYMVYVDKEHIVIYTDLEDGKSYSYPNISFEAYAYLSGEEIPVRVSVNDKKIAEKTEHCYEYRLQEGKNKISIQAAKGKKKVQETYQVDYQKSKEKIYIETDLKNQQVSEEKFQFRAKGYIGGEEERISVKWNEEEIAWSEEGRYELRLKNGENVISLELGEQKQKYSIIYKENVGTGEDKDENAPIITCSLKDGATVNNKNLNFQLNAKDYQGKWLDQSYVTVTCGGKKASLIYANKNQISYKALLTEGYNVVVIKVHDKEGNTAKKAYSIYYKKLDGGIIGTVTISVEATTIGCGSLIKPTKVDIPEDTNAAVLVCELLEKYGFTYEYSGTKEKNFYLARISKNENFLTPAVPKDLEAHLLQEDKNYPGSYYLDSLGEFDFATGSGWMYSVNGIYPNYGFSDCYLQDGDVLRVRFTLRYGADIGGAMASGNGGNEGDSGNWEKEW